MSCNSNCYLPIPPRAWSRVQNNCSLFDETNFNGLNLVSTPYSRKQVPASTLYLEYAMLNKGNVLQYKKNSSNLTKQQRYAQIAKGMWTNRNTTWATQSTRGFTNPNNQSLQRVNNINITLDGQATLAPVTCPNPIVPVNQPLPPPSSGGSSNPEVIPPPPPPPTVNSGTALPPTIIEIFAEPVVIQDLGNLVCGTQQNVCTGELIRQPTNIICHPTSDSDVPGPLMELCWNDGNPTWYPRQRYIMTNSGNKWPTNAALLSAVKIPPPTIVYSNVIDNLVTLIWTQDEKCIPATKFTIYEDGIPIKIVSGNVFTASIFISSGNGEYVFYIVASNSTIISDPSNSVTIIVVDSCHYNIFGNYSVNRNYNTGSYTITFMYNPMNSNSIQLGCTVNNISATLVAGGGGGGRGAQTTIGNYGGGGGGGGGGIYTNTINLLADTYNIVVGNLGKGSSNPSDSIGQYGTDSYIQGSSSLVIAIATAGGGGNSTQSGQTSGSTPGSGGGPIAGGYGGKGGFSGTNGGAGVNGQSSNLSPYSGGGGGGCGSTCCGGTSASNGIGGIQGCATNITGSNGSDAISYGGGGGGGSSGGSGGNGYYGVIIFVI
jgi:hypothetical protein